MPIYFFWGEDDFALDRAVRKLREAVLDPQWLQFNYDKVAGDGPDAMEQALTSAMTPPLGGGGRLVWLAEATLCQHCSQDLLGQLERSLPAISASAHLLMTSRKKPDGRLKSTKLLQDWAEIREFSPIPPWKTEALVHQVEALSQEVGVKLTPAAVEWLAESVGNHSRQLWNELEKLRLYGEGNAGPLDVGDITPLVNASTQNSLQLAGAIRQGNSARALELAADLIAGSEPPLRIAATLVGQFRTWSWVKLRVEAGERDERAIARSAEIGNPKRVYFLRQEVRSLDSSQLLKALPLLRELEYQLKKGAEPLSTLQVSVVRLCQLFAPAVDSIATAR